MAKKGVEVKVFEEHSTIGEPNHCAGLLSVEGLRRLDLEPSPEFVQNEIRGGTIHSPNGTSIRIAGSRTRAYVVNRTDFDRHLAEEARREGVEIETGCRVSELVLQEGKVTGVLGDMGAVNADVVIDAEGASGSLAKALGLRRPVEGFLSGVNIDVSGVDLEPDMVEVWIGGRLAPGLFAWVIPTREGKARCGLGCSGGGAHERLMDFIVRRFGDVACANPTRWALITSGPVGRTYCDGMLLAGDVVGQTKPTTGGGVILGGLCAIEAGRTAAEALGVGDSSSNFLSRYEKRWKTSLGREFSSMLSARRFINRISDPQLDKLFGAMKSSGLEDTIEGLVEEGDMDMQSGVIGSALKHPGLLRVLASCVGRLALSELRGFFKL